jgi:outer membrane lipoprotein-sorting protein
MSRLKRSASFPAVVLLVLAGLAAAVAGSAGGDAKSILKKADKAGWTKASHALIEQTITTTGGSTRTFKIESWTKNGDEKQLMKYLAPAQSRGIGVLTLEGGENIWVYFPDSDDLRKIASSARNQSVEGSDFTYEDLSTQTLSKTYEPKLLGEEKIDGVVHHKLELTPKQKSFYSKLIIWIHKASFTVPKIEYYDKKGDHVKTLLLKEYEKVKGVWVAREMVMKNHKRGSKTTIKIIKIKINPELDDKMFTTQNLTVI